MNTHTWRVFCWFSLSLLRWWSVWSPPSITTHFWRHKTICFSSESPSTVGPLCLLPCTLSPLLTPYFTSSQLTPECHAPLRCPTLVGLTGSFHHCDVKRLLSGLGEASGSVKAQAFTTTFGSSVLINPLTAATVSLPPTSSNMSISRECL